MTATATPSKENTAITAIKKALDHIESNLESVTREISTNEIYLTELDNRKAGLLQAQIEVKAALLKLQAP